jgi:hypothetical protein
LPNGAAASISLLHKEQRMSPAAAEVRTQITYLLPTSRVNRVFWAPGADYNTGV